MIDLHHGDCLELMAAIPDGSVDMILCDLPYGTTACKWYTVIPFEPLWAHYRRIAKRNAAIVLTASKPFTTTLIGSNMRDFRYCWIYQKNNPTGFLDARRRPMNDYEDVCVFSQEATQYYPQGVVTKQTKQTKQTTEVYGKFGFEYMTTGTNYPRRVIQFQRPSKTQHPTQKPVALMEYLIRTYTREGETVLDNCMGSGTTGVACANTGRKFIGIEQDAKYFAIAQERIAQAQPRLVA